MKEKNSAIWVGIFFITILAILNLGSVRRVIEGRVVPVMFWFEKPVANILFSSCEKNSNGALLNVNRDLEEQILVLEKENAGNNAPLPHGLAAEVMGFSPEKGYGLMYIDKGMNAGVKTGDMVLIANNTLAGRVLEVQNDFSIAQSLFSKDINISVEIGNSRVPGLFSNANGSDSGDLSLVPGDASPSQILQGKTWEGEPTADSLVETSGQDGLFPRGILIGTLKDIKEVPAAASLEGTIQIPYEPMDLDRVFIISNPFSQSEH